MVSALVSGSSSLGSSPGRGHCVVFSASHHPSKGGGVEILLVAPCYRPRDKLRPDGPLGSYADFTLPIFTKASIEAKKQTKTEKECMLPSPCHPS